MISRVLIFAVIVIAARAQDDPEGQKVLERVCGHCHKLTIVTSRHLTKEGWQQTVQAMVDKGADASDEDFARVIDYLTKHYGPRNGSGKINVNKATAAQLSAALEISDAGGTAIVQYRETNGNFKSWQDLTKVPGIDIKKLEANKDRLEF